MEQRHHQRVSSWTSSLGFAGLLMQSSCTGREKTPKLETISVWGFCLQLWVEDSLPQFWHWNSDWGRAPGWPSSPSSHLQERAGNVWDRTLFMQSLRSSDHLTNIPLNTFKGALLTLNVPALPLKQAQLLSGTANTGSTLSLLLSCSATWRWKESAGFPLC